MEDGAQRGVAAAFPPPPPFWKHFTPANLSKLEDAKREARPQDSDDRESMKEWTPAELRTLNVGPQLRYLIPPEPPTDDYVLFGEKQQLSPNPPSLVDQGITQLYPSSPPTTGHAYHLTKITKSLLLNFLELTGILSIAPEHAAEKLEMIRTLFINSYHLLNLYRPHQARESLGGLIEQRIELAREEVTQMEEVEGRVADWLQNMTKEGKEEDSVDEGDIMQLEQDGGNKAGKESTALGEEERELKEAQMMWRLLDEIDELG